MYTSSKVNDEQILQSSSSQLSKLSPTPSEALNGSKKNLKSSEILENFGVSRNGSNFSDLAFSFSTEQITPSQRVSIASDDFTEVNFNQFRFERKIQNKLSLKPGFCQFCKCNCYFIERIVTRKMNLLGVLEYWFYSLQCYSDPRAVNRYLAKQLFCVCCEKMATEESVDL